MRVLVGIPWRPEPHRVYAHDLVLDTYRTLLPDATVLDFDTEHETFCLAGARNLAVKFGERAGADVVVLGDADTLPEREPLVAAIEAAATDRVVHLPYTQYRSLRRAGTNQFLAGRPLEDCGHVVVPYATSGVYVASPATWWACGGQDERFLGWAPEDVAWLICHRILLGAEPARHEGRVHSLHHESPVKTGAAYDDAVRLFQRYLEAGETGDPEAIRALINERAAKPQVA